MHILGKKLPFKKKTRQILTKATSFSKTFQTQILLKKALLNPSQYPFSFMLIFTVDLKNGNRRAWPAPGCARPSSGRYTPHSPRIPHLQLISPLLNKLWDLEWAGIDNSFPSHPSCPGILPILSLESMPSHCVGSSLPPIPSD